MKFAIFVVAAIALIGAIAISEAYHGYHGMGLGYNHADGHALGLSQSTIPNFGRQLELAGKANLWSSPDRNTRLDLTGAGSKWTSGPFSGKTDYNAGLGLTHMFG